MLHRRRTCAQRGPREQAFDPALGVGPVPSTHNAVIIPAVGPGQLPSATPAGGRQAAFNDNRPSDVKLDQYYTRRDVALRLYATFGQYCDPSRYLMVEPSAGTGAFYRLLPPGSLAYDLDPKYPGVETADFLSTAIESDRPIAIIGNPPFGKNASMAVRFFNHAARCADAIGFIVPRTFRKASIQNRLHRSFHLTREDDVASDAFIFRGRPYDVPAVFQIWQRRAEPRARRPVPTRHPDFEFTTPDRADFAIQRVGARAGRVHHDFGRSASSHYFIVGAVEPIMRDIDFSQVIGDVAGNPSLSKAEIVSLYSEQVRGRQPRPS